MSASPSSPPTDRVVHVALAPAQDADDTEAAAEPEAPATVAHAGHLLDRRAREARSQYARDIAEAGKTHGLDLPLTTRPDGEVVLLTEGYPDKVPFGMLLSLVSLRAPAYRREGRIDVAHALLAEVDDFESMGDSDIIADEETADAFRVFADQVLDDAGAPRIEVDLVV